MKRSSFRTALLLTPMLTAALTAGACGGPATQCEAMTSRISGHMDLDLLGSWQSAEAQPASVYAFNPDGTYRFVEPPAPSSTGSVHTGSFQVIDGLLTLHIGAGQRTTPIAVTATTLVGLGPDYQRVTCTGYGF